MVETYATVVDGAEIRLQVEARQSDQLGTGLESGQHLAQSVHVDQRQDAKVDVLPIVCSLQ